MASTIQVRVDDDLKTKSDALFKDLGTDTTTAIRIFLTQAIAVNGFPFEIKRANTNPYEALTEHEILDKLEISTATHLDIGNKLENNDYIYVTGGNTFFLLQEMHRSGAGNLLKHKSMQGNYL